MTTKTKDAVFVTLFMIIGLAVTVGDLHRIILQAVWPVMIAYFDWLFS